MVVIKKLTRSYGFTLMELLIVVAIIAILIAVMIPTMKDSVTKTKESADVANIRAAYAEVRATALLNDTPIVSKRENGTVSITTSQKITEIELNFPEKFSGPDSSGTFFYNAEGHNLNYSVNFNLGTFSENNS